MRKHLPLIVLGAAACASSMPVTNTGVTASPNAVVVAMGEKVSLNAFASSSDAELTFTVDEVWKVLPEVLDALGVKVTVRDPAQHTIGSERAKYRMRLGRTPLSRYLECGGTQVGANADSYDVALTALIQLQPAATGGSTLRMVFDAEAKPIALSQAYSRCSTKGVFESQLAEAVKKRLQR